MSQWEEIPSPRTKGCFSTSIVSTTKDILQTVIIILYDKGWENCHNHVLCKQCFHFSKLKCLFNFQKGNLQINFPTLIQTLTTVLDLQCSHSHLIRYQYAKVPNQKRLGLSTKNIPSFFFSWSLGGSPISILNFKNLRSMVETLLLKQYL